MKREYLEIMKELEEKTRSKVMILLTQRFRIPEYDAKDILQDAWLLLLEKLTDGTLSEMPNKLLAYMLNVCDKKAHEYLRKRTYENLETSLDDDTFTADRLDGIQKEIQSWVDFIEESEREKERKMEAIERAIKTLNPRQRALLEGYYYNHKTMKELAERLGYSNEDVAKSTKNRIMNSIRTTIKQQERANRSRLSPAAFLKHFLIEQYTFRLVENGTDYNKEKEVKMAAALTSIAEPCCRKIAASNRQHKIALRA